MPTKKEQATAVAKALKEELTFSAPLKGSLQEKWVNRLYDKPPDRSDIGFQASDNVNPQLTSKPKEVLGQAVAEVTNLEKAQHLFCMSHGDFCLIPGMDIDHSVAYSKIKENQAVFIDYLNENEEFADAFLAEPEMTNYFRRDPQDKKVKGTFYFYKICYNAIDNLWLVCHPCNITKSDQEELKWFSNNHRFGSSFIEAVNAEGGLHTGVMLSVIGGQCIAELQISGEKYNIYTNGIGFGKFVRNWVTKIYEKEYQIHQKWKNENVATFSKEVEQINQLVLEGKQEQANAQFKNLKKNLINSKNALQVNYSRYDSDSGSETPSQQAVQTKVSKDIFVDQDDKKHHLKILENELKEKYPLSEAEIHKQFLELLEKILKDVPLDNINKLRSTIEADINKTVLPEWTAIKEKINSSVTTTEDALILEKQATAAETQKRQAAEQATAAALQEAAAEKEKAAQLREQLAKLLSAQPNPALEIGAGEQKGITRQFDMEKDADEQKRMQDNKRPAPSDQDNDNDQDKHKKMGLGDKG